MKRRIVHLTARHARLPGAAAWVSWPSRSMAFLLAIAFGIALASCSPSEVESGSDEPAVPDENALVEEALSVQSSEGPVTAVVTLTPAEPRLGDPLVLTLAVTAKAGVTVDMPAFGDALGRFAIVDFTPSQEVADDGGVRLSQRYTLQAPTSGRQRIPRLRLEFLDERDPGVAAKPRELLTDEIGFAVASVLPADQPLDELRPARAGLEELRGPWLRRNWPWLVVGLGVLAALAAGVVWWLRRAEERARSTAFDRAMARLDRLRRRGLPEGNAVDAWYVELSDIVRRYVEERFALRAPELTTEEFLVEAGRSRELTVEHRDLVSAFLATCDRVKFARYSPGDKESREALENARRFLTESGSSSVEDVAQTQAGGRRAA